jgi:hypothetical protein
MYLNQQYVKANFGVGTVVYEVNQSTRLRESPRPNHSWIRSELRWALRWRLPSTFC